MTRPSIGNVNPAVGQAKLERKDWASHVIETANKWSFKAEKGGSVRASRFRAILADIHCALVWLGADLAYSLGLMPPKARASHEDVLARRKNKRCVDDVLDCLKALKNDGRSRFPDSRALAMLGERSEGDLENLKGGREALKAYLRRSSDADLMALRQVLLDSPDCSVFMLGQVAGQDYDNASRVLDQIAKALDKRLIQIGREPLKQIAKLVGEVNLVFKRGDDLAKHLSRLSGSPVIDMLDRCIQSLPENLQDNLQFVRSKEGAGVCQSALIVAGHDRGPVYDVLHLVRGALERNEQAQAQRKALISDSKRLMGNFLRSLSAPVNDTGALGRIAEELRLLIDLSEGHLTRLPEKALSLLFDPTDHELSGLGFLILRDAMSKGILGFEFGRELILEQLPPGKLPNQASRLLSEIEGTVDWGFRVNVEMPLEGLARQLDADSVDGDKLLKVLSRLAAGLDLSAPAVNEVGEYAPIVVLLSGHFQSLPESELQSLLPLADRNELVRCSNALTTFGAPQKERAQKMLNYIHQSLVHSQAA